MCCTFFDVCFDLCSSKTLLSAVVVSLRLTFAWLGAHGTAHLVLQSTVRLGTHETCMLQAKDGVFEDCKMGLVSREVFANRCVELLRCAFHAVRVCLFLKN